MYINMASSESIAKLRLPSNSLSTFSTAASEFISLSDPTFREGVGTHAPASAVSRNHDSSSKLFSFTPSLLSRLRLMLSMRSENEVLCLLAAKTTSKV